MVTIENFLRSLRAVYITTAEIEEMKFQEIQLKSLTVCMHCFILLQSYDSEA